MISLVGCGKEINKQSEVMDTVNEKLEKQLTEEEIKERLLKENKDRNIVACKLLDVFEYKEQTYKNVYEIKVINDKDNEDSGIYYIDKETKEIICKGTDIENKNEHLIIVG